MAVGLLVGAGGVWALIVGDPGVKLLGLCGLALGLPIAIFMSPSLTRLHIVHWSEEGVEGPCALFGLTLGRARTFILWSEIVGTGETGAGYWFVEARDGRRVYWSYLYKGYRAFAVAIEAHCPGL